MRTQDVTRYRIRMEREMCQFKVTFRSEFQCVLKFKFRRMDGSGNLFPLAVVWGVEATESLNDLRHRIFSNTKEHTKIRNLPPTDETDREHIK